MDSDPRKENASGDDSVPVYEAPILLEPLDFTTEIEQRKETRVAVEAYEGDLTNKVFAI